MTIRFLLKAEPNYKGVLRVLEYYEFDSGVLYDNGKGGKESRPIIGLVDEDIRTQHKKAYEEWKADVDAHDAELYQAAKDAFVKEKTNA